MTLDAIPAGVTRIKIEPTAPPPEQATSVSTMLCWATAATTSSSPWPDKKDINVGNVSSHEFTGLEAAKQLQLHRTGPQQRLLFGRFRPHHRSHSHLRHRCRRARSDFAVRAVPSGVEVVSPVDVAITVYNVTGTAVHTAPVAAGTTVVTLPAGMYIVRVVDTVAKVIVR